MTHVKICGISTADAYDAVVEAGANFAGFVFYPPSPRNVSPQEAAALIARHAQGPYKVGLFVEPTDEDIARVLDVAPLDYLQLNTSAERARDIRARFMRPVIHAVHVASADDLPRSAHNADIVLLDAAPPAGATLPGGNAVSFNWDLLRGYTPGFPWMLAGGLTPANIADAIRRTGASMVDVSSGVEKARGVKDTDLIRTFITAARSAQTFAV